MDKEIIEGYEKTLYELAVAKTELEVKEQELKVLEQELKIENGRHWNERCKNEAHLEHDIQLQRLAYFKKLNEEGIVPKI